MSVPLYERVLDLFEAEGIDTLFGIPDPGFIHMAMTAEKRGWNVVGPHHEQAGAFMADGWSRLTGKPGVVFGTQGPGITNLAAAMIVAAKENSPTIFLGGNRHRIAENRVRRGRIQHLNQTQYFEAAMKYVGVIEYPEQTDEVIHEALRRCQSGRPGPVYVEIPIHLVEAKLDWGRVMPPHAYRLVHQEASASAVREAVQLIRNAKRPVLMVGQGVFTARAQQDVAKLAKALACPIIRTQGTDAYLPGLEDRTFAYGFTPAGREAVIESDLCIAIGTELGEPSHYGVGRHWEKNNATRKWIYIERDSDAIGVNRPIDVPLVGDLRDIVPQLVEALKDTPRTESADLKRLVKMHAEYGAQLVAEAPTSEPQIHTAQFVIEATKNLPPDTVWVRDGGSVSIFGWTYMQNRPLDALWNQNLGHLGTGLPYALGAQVAVGSARRVVLITSDSTFLFHTTELETALRKNLPVVVVVGVDYQWGLEVGVCMNIFGKDVKATEGYLSKTIRFDKIAEGLGCHGEYVERTEDIAAAVQRALDSGKPAVVHVNIDPVANATGCPGFEEFSSWYSDVAVWKY